MEDDWASDDDDGLGDISALPAVDLSALPPTAPPPNVSNPTPSPKSAPAPRTTTTTTHTPPHHQHQPHQHQHQHHPPPSPSPNPSAPPPPTSATTPPSGTVARTPQFHQGGIGSPSPPQSAGRQTRLQSPALHGASHPRSAWGVTTGGGNISGDARLHPHVHHHPHAPAQGGGRGGTSGHVPLRRGDVGGGGANVGGGGGGGGGGAVSQQMMHGAGDVRRGMAMPSAVGAAATVPDAVGMGAGRGGGGGGGGGSAPVSLFVSNLPGDATQAAIDTFFRHAKCYTSHIRLLRHNDTNKPYAAIVTLHADVTVRQALSLNGCPLNGRPVSIRLDDPRRGGGGGGGGSSGSPMGGVGGGIGPPGISPLSMQQQQPYQQGGGGGVDIVGRRGPIRGGSDGSASPFAMSPPRQHHGHVPHPSAAMSPPSASGGGPLSGGDDRRRYQENGSGGGGGRGGGGGGRQQMHSDPTIPTGPIPTGRKKLQLKPRTKPPPVLDVDQRAIDPPSQRNSTAVARPPSASAPALLVPMTAKMRLQAEGQGSPPSDSKGQQHMMHSPLVQSPIPKVAQPSMPPMPSVLSPPQSQLANPVLNRSPPIESLQRPQAQQAQKHSEPLSPPPQSLSVLKPKTPDVRESSEQSGQDGKVLHAKTEHGLLQSSANGLSVPAGTVKSSPPAQPVASQMQRESVKLTPSSAPPPYSPVVDVPEQLTELAEKTAETNAVPSKPESRPVASPSIAASGAAGVGPIAMGTGREIALNNGFRGNGYRDRYGHVISDRSVGMRSSGSDGRPRQDHHRPHGAPGRRPASERYGSNRPHSTDRPGSQRRSHRRGGGGGHDGSNRRYRDGSQGARGRGGDRHSRHGRKTSPAGVLPGAAMGGGGGGGGAGGVSGGGDSGGGDVATNSGQSAERGTWKSAKEGGAVNKVSSLSGGEKKDDETGKFKSINPFAALEDHVEDES